MAPKRGHLVRMEGLEPTHLSALDPKSSVSTNFTTSAVDFLKACAKISSYCKYQNRNRSDLQGVEKEKFLPLLKTSKCAVLTPKIYRFLSSTVSF